MTAFSSSRRGTETKDAIGLLTVNACERGGHILYVLTGGRGQGGILSLLTVFLCILQPWYFDSIEIQNAMAVRRILGKMMPCCPSIKPACR